MKLPTILTLVALTAAVAWLGARQMRMREQLRVLATAQAAAAAPSPASAEAEAARREIEIHLERSRLHLAAAEQRLAETTAKAETLQRTLDALAARIQHNTSRASSWASSAESGSFDAVPRLNRNWGPEQVVGPPNTHEAGDITTAWASRNPDDGEEWLKLDYEKPVDLAEVRVRETYNPGAITKVTAVLDSGQELTIWEGVEPAAEAPVEMSFRVNSRVQAKSVKVYLDTKRVPGWNEIDAVELVGHDGSRQWASGAAASSTFAER
jgi:hypothetical protein